MTATPTVRPARRAPLRLLALAVIGAIGFQVVHVTDHALQVLVWLVHPSATPWLTPWAVTGADALAHVAGAAGGGGVELLHLVGNLVFLPGLAGAVRLLDGTGGGGPRPLRLALWLQTAHVAEHVLLTATWFSTGTALGLSTAFGSLTASPVVATALRVWFHFTVNGVATVLAVRGLRSAWPVLRPILDRSRVGPRPARRTALRRPLRSDQHGPAARAVRSRRGTACGIGDRNPRRPPGR